MIIALWITFSPISHIISMGALVHVTFFIADATRVVAMMAREITGFDRTTQVSFQGQSVGFLVA
jgi:hypothetical protein